MHSATNAVVLRYLRALDAGALILELLQEPGVDKACIPCLPLGLIAGHLSPTDAALHQPGASFITPAVTSTAPLLRQFRNLSRLVRLHIINATGRVRVYDLGGSPVTS